MGKMQIDPWQRLEGKVSPLVLEAPRTGGDPLGKWKKVSDKLVAHLERNVVGKLWANQLVLTTAILVAHNLDESTILGILRSLNARWDDLVPVLGLQTMSEWNANHMRQYLGSEVLLEDKPGIRRGFWSNYNNVFNHTQRWLRSLPAPDREQYRPFLLAYIDQRDLEGLTSNKEIKERQQEKRKAETDALMPHFLDIHAQAHLRFNKMKRLKEAWVQALKTIIDKNLSYPFEFSYNESQECLHFVIWDRRSFALAHQNLYSKATLKKAVEGTGSYSDDNNRPFLEFIKAERLSDEAPPEGLWFSEMLKTGVIGQAGQRLRNQQLAEERQDWLRAWGYGGEDTNERSAPFRVSIAGVLSWTSKDAVFIGNIHQKTQGVFIPVESLYVAALFGLLATELFITTGMRINELLQTNLTKEAFTRVKLPPTPGKSASYRYTFHLIPKGERTDKLHDFFIAPKTANLLRKVMEMLVEHYAIDLEEAGNLPVIPFSPNHSRSHRFKEAPYLFQYNYQHLDDRDITACMRFLLHGMIFKTREGDLVTIKAHLLRHGFANHAVQVEKIPIDIVGNLLHQKNLDVTWYYSEATTTQIAEYADLMLAKMASHFNLEEYISRSPEELREQLEEARQQIGTLNKVVGGDCTFHARCIHGMICVGCSHNVPDPRRRHEVERKRDWAVKQLDHYSQEGILLEAEHFKNTIRNCDLMLREMDLIDHYEEDEKQEVQINVK